MVSVFSLIFILYKGKVFFLHFVSFIKPFFVYLNSIYRLHSFGLVLCIHLEMVHACTLFESISIQNGFVADDRECFQLWKELILTYCPYVDKKKKWGIGALS